MALIDCPECKKQVSDQAKSCPNCGFQVASYYYQKTKEEKKKEQQELLNKKIAEREKQKQIKINKIKKNKRKFILIPLISLVLIIAIIVGSIFLFHRLQIKTFKSESEMKNYVEGVYVEEHDELLNYRLTIEDGYIIEENYGTMKNYPKYGENYSFNSKKFSYRISDYDYKNGKIITDETTYYYSEKDENANDLFSYITKTNTFDSRKEFIVKKDNVISDSNHTYIKRS